MSTFNFLKEGEKLKDKIIICEKLKDKIKIYKIKEKIIGIYSFSNYSDNFFNNCKINRNKIVYQDGPEKYEFPKLKCKKCKIIIYDMI